MPRYQSGAIQLHTTDLNGGSAVNIGGVVSMNVPTGTETMSDDSGSTYDEVRSIHSQRPEPAITTKSVAAILDLIGLAGYCISSDGTHPGLRLFGEVLNDCKSPPAAGTNARYTIGKGLVILGQLNAPRGQDATISLVAHAITDGTNAPIAGVYSSVTLPSGLVTAQFTLGHCKVGAVVLADLESVSIEFGVQITAKTPETGGVWPDSVAVRKIQPVVTLTGFDPRVLDDTSGIPLLGKQAAHANTLIQLKKRLGYSAFVNPATEQHIAITVNGIATVTDAFSGTGNAEATNAIRVEGVHDGTNVPILIDTTAAYDPTP